MNSKALDRWLRPTENPNGSRSPVPTSLGPQTKSLKTRAERNMAQRSLKRAVASDEIATLVNSGGLVEQMLREGIIGLEYRSAIPIRALSNMEVGEQGRQMLARAQAKRERRARLRQVDLNDQKTSVSTSKS